MLDNRFLAGVIAGIPISLLCLAYVAARRDVVVRVLTERSGDGDGLAPSAATGLAFVLAAVIGPVLGIAAAVAYGSLPSEAACTALAFGLATLFSLAALVTRTPLMVEKIILNYAVATMLGVVMPRLAGG